MIINIIAIIIISIITSIIVILLLLMLLLLIRGPIHLEESRFGKFLTLGCCELKK